MSIGSAKRKSPRAGAHTHTHIRPVTTGSLKRTHTRPVSIGSVKRTHTHPPSSSSTQASSLGFPLPRSQRPPDSLQASFHSFLKASDSFKMPQVTRAELISHPGKRGMMGLIHSTP